MENYTGSIRSSDDDVRKLQCMSCGRPIWNVDYTDISLLLDNNNITFRVICNRCLRTRYPVDNHFPVLTDDRLYRNEFVRDLIFSESKCLINSSASSIPSACSICLKKEDSTHRVEIPIGDYRNQYGGILYLCEEDFHMWNIIKSSRFREDLCGRCGNKYIITSEEYNTRVVTKSLGSYLCISCFGKKYGTLYVERMIQIKCPTCGSLNLIDKGSVNGTDKVICNHCSNVLNRNLLGIESGRPGTTLQIKAIDAYKKEVLVEVYIEILKNTKNTEQKIIRVSKVSFDKDLVRISDTLFTFIVDIDKIPESFLYIYRYLYDNYFVFNGHKTIKVDV